MLEPSDTAAALADAVLSRKGYRSRVRRLREAAGAYGPELVAELTSRSEVASRRDTREAVEAARLGALAASALGDPVAYAECHRVLARAAIVAGDFPSALKALDRALARARLAGDGLLVADLESLRVGALVGLERFGEAREVCRRLLRFHKVIDDREGSVRVRMILADLAFRRDRPREALRHYRVVNSLLPAEEASPVHAELALRRAEALEACRRPQAAARSIERARQISACSL
jgi:tetratricopeptide (TPR) repeat protein